MSVLVLSALSASTIGIFLFYKPNSKAGNGFRWAIAPMGTVVARQLSQNGFTEATLVTSLLVFVVLMLMLWPFGYIIYKKKADTNDQQKIIAKKDIDMGLRGGDTMKSSDDDIANEISSSEMSDYEKAGNELETGNHVKGLWIKADVDADGDAGKRKRLYIKMRVSQLAEEREAKKKLRRREEKRREEELKQLEQSPERIQSRYGNSTSAITNKNINNRNSIGETALMRAVTNQDVYAVKYLLKLGADPTMELNGVSVAGLARDTEDQYIMQLIYTALANY